MTRLYEGGIWSTDSPLHEPLFLEGEGESHDLRTKPRELRGFKSWGWVNAGCLLGSRAQSPRLVKALLRQTVPLLLIGQLVKGHPEGGAPERGKGGSPAPSPYQEKEGGGVTRAGIPSSREYTP